MGKRRRLVDLYQRGKDFTFTDDSGEPVVVYVRKLSPVEHETAVRKANARRAEMLMTKSRPDSDEWKNLWAESRDITDRALLTKALLQPKINDCLAKADAELALDESWAKDGYLEGLRDRWDDEMSKRYEDDPEDSEAKSVFAELRRFSDEVTEFASDNVAALEREYAAKDLEELQDEFVAYLIDLQATTVWTREYRRCQVWLGTKEPTNHAENHFDSRDEVDQLNNKLLIELLSAYESLSVDVMEGKGSQETDTSSGSPESQKQVETEVSFGPLAAIQ